DEPGGEGILVADVLLDLLLEMPGDDDQLFDIELGHFVHHVIHHRPSGDPDQGLGDRPGAGEEPGAFACEWDDDFHQLRPYLSLRRTTSSTSGVDASSRSAAVTASIWCTVGGVM